ncbi:hypothetical protein ACFW04_012026 [Cataglyphis niger]
MTVHHQQNHHVAALSGVAVANNGLNLSRMSGLEAHRLENMVDRNGVAIERLSNGLDSRNNNLNNNNNNNNNNGLERGDASTTMPQRSRFMITDILGGASSKVHQSGLPSQDPPGSPPSTPRDLSVRHQSRTSLSTSNLDEDSDASHHDGASVTSNGVKDIYGVHGLFRPDVPIGVIASIVTGCDCIECLSFENHIYISLYIAFQLNVRIIKNPSKSHLRIINYYYAIDSRKVAYIAVKSSIPCTNRTLVPIKAEILQKAGNASNEKKHEHTRAVLKRVFLFIIIFPSFKLITRVRYWCYQSAVDARAIIAIINGSHLPWYAIRASGRSRNY